ncbi:hypothetical protein DRJ22_00185 [Candidatus Woesearchaeota archaeon]|nr:MAG: hypothetical protein DRJ22_00185 [Candidatus Woesearchaeota archaeon]
MIKLVYRKSFISFSFTFAGMVKEDYVKLKKKFPSLPEFDELDSEFDLCKIENSDHLLKKIVVRMSEVLEKIIDNLESVLQPDANSFIELYECKAFDEKELQDVVDVFRKLMFCFHSLQEAELDSSKRVETISSVFDIWVSLKKKLVFVLSKQKECWEKPFEKDEIVGYLG